ncbi:hypothetical protein DSECCO2_643770 [anaerobic digester metagenome]
MRRQRRLRASGAELLHPVGMGDHLDLDTCKTFKKVLCISERQSRLLALVQVDGDPRGGSHTAVTLPRSSALTGPPER